MKQKIYKVLLDIYKGVLNNQLIEFTTEDNGSNVLEFEILEDKLTPYNLNDCMVRMVINGQQQDCTISDSANGKVEVVLLQSMFAEPGPVFAELQIYDATNQTIRLTTPAFRYNVRKSLMNDDTIQADPNYSILQNMILDVSNADAVSKEALQAANQAKSIVDTLVPKTNEAAQNAQEALDRAESVVTQEELAQKIMLGDKETNFKFIENKTLSSILGAMSNRYYDGGNTDRITISTTELTEFMMAAKFETRSGGDIFWTKDNDNLIVYDSSIGVSLKTNGVYSFKTMNTPKLTNKETELVLQLKNGVFSVFINGRKHGELFGDSIRISTLNIFGNHNFTFKNRGWLDYIIISDKVLTPQEIEASLTIHNNTPPIKELHTTDSTGKTSISYFGSDEDHVEMSTGRTLREEYMCVLKTMGKEFVSSDGSSVEVNNGIEARVISGEIKGQTVKTFCKVACDLKPSWGSSDVHFDKYANTFEMTRNEDMQLESEFYGEKGKVYTIIANVISNNATTVSRLVTGGADQVVSAHLDIKPGQLGLIKYKFTANVGDTTGKLKMYKPKTTAGLFKLQGYVLLEGDWTMKSDEDLLNICRHFKSGLNSTQAIISNSGQQYSIYESTINGKTRILKAPKGTQNWVEISADEVRDTAKFDYKLESINGDLGSVPSVADYIDRARKVKVFATKEITVNGDNWTIDSPQQQDVVCVKMNRPSDCLDISQVIPCDKIESLPVYGKNIEGIYAYNGAGQIKLNIAKSKLISPDLNGVKQYLNSNPFKMRYQLITPQTVQLTDEEFKAYDVYKKLISLPFPEDKVTLNADGSATWVDASNRKMLTIKETWLKSSVQNADANCFQIEVIDADNDQSKIIVFCDKLESVTGASTLNASTLKPNTCGIDGSRYLRIGVPKSVETVEQMKEFAKDFNIIYRSKIQDITYIDKSIVPTILTNKTNIWEVGGAVKASSYKITQPIDKLALIEVRLQALENTTVDVVLNK